MTYRRDFRDFSREVYWTGPRIFMWGLFASILLAFFTLVTLPMGIIGKVATPDNVLTNYSRFHDLHGVHKMRIAQIKDYRTITPLDAADASRIRIEIAAMQQTCREAATRYNADAAKVHVGIFKGQSLPETLSVAACD